MPVQIIPNVVTRHAEEAAFLWHLRNHLAAAPHIALRQLAEHDERVEAHLDGLRVAGDAGWETAAKQLEATPEAGETFAAGVLAAESGLPARMESVAKAAAASPKNARALISALGWLPAATAMERIKPWFATDTPVLRRVAIGSAAIHRRDPGPALQRLLEDSDLGVKARALRAVGELGAGNSLPAVGKYLRHADLTCRFWACWSAARLGDKPAVAELQMIAQAEIRHRARAVNMAVRCAESSATLRWLDVLGQLPGGERLAIQGYGGLGDPSAVPRLLQAMKTPALARVAGEASTFITGVDLDAQKLEGQKPEGFEAGPNDDPADENVAMDPDDNLPWPDIDKISRWWEKNQANFRPGKRLLLGKPMDLEWLREVLRIGKQRQRAAAALELALREPGKPLFEVRAPGFRQ
jgi:uncharacterized protein (TIGR02270 family)